MIREIFYKIWEDYFYAFIYLKYRLAENIGFVSRYIPERFQTQQCPIWDIKSLLRSARQLMITNSVELTRVLSLLPVNLPCLCHSTLLSLYNSIFLILACIWLMYNVVIRRQTRIIHWLEAVLRRPRTTTIDDNRTTVTKRRWTNK